MSCPPETTGSVAATGRKSLGLANCVPVSQDTDLSCLAASRLAGYTSREVSKPWLSNATKIRLACVKPEVSSVEAGFPAIGRGAGELTEAGVLPGTWARGLQGLGLYCVKRG